MNSEQWSRFILKIKHGGMNLANPITPQLVHQRRQELMARFAAAFDPDRIPEARLQQLHAEVCRRQAELLPLVSATQRQISKYFLTFQPLACNPATFADLRTYGGPRIAVNHGKLYIGTIVEGKRHGKGVIVSQRGKVYEGEMLLNERNGVGVEIYENGNFYIGGFACSKRNGQGRMVWANRHPQPSEHSPSVTYQYYAGQWANGEPHGRGVHSTEAWDFVGSFKLGVRSGRGIEVRPGMVFEGNFSNNLREGKGVLIEDGVEFYEGEFRGGRKHGYGRWRCLSSGEEYEGFFQDNRKEGIGVSLKDGTLYRGLFTEDRPNGTGEFLKPASLTKDRDRSITEVVKRSPKPRAQLQSAQFVRSNAVPVLKPQLSQRSLQKIVRPPKVARLDSSRDKEQRADSKSVQRQREVKKLKGRGVSASVIRVVKENPERHACSYKHCSCHKWEQQGEEKLKIDETRILRLFSARKSLLKSIV